MADQETKVRELLLAGQLAHATGCSPDEAHRLLAEHSWQLEAAISAWFTPAPHLSLADCFTHCVLRTDAPQFQQQSQYHQALCPCNTPATPPSVTDTIHAFQKMEWKSNLFEGTRLSDDRQNNHFCTPSATNQLS